MQQRKKSCKSKAGLKKNNPKIIHTKKEISALKKAYKKGDLKFNAKDIASGMLEDFGHGLFKKK